MSIRKLPVELYMDIFEKMKYDDIVKLSKTNSHIKNVYDANKKIIARKIFKDLNYNVSGITNLTLLISRLYELDKQLSVNYDVMKKAIGKGYNDVLHLIIHNIDLGHEEPTQRSSLIGRYKIDSAARHAMDKKNYDALRMIMPHTVEKRFVPVYALMRGYIDSFEILLPFFELERGESLGEGMVMSVAENGLDDPHILLKVIDYAKTVDPTYVPDWIQITRSINAHRYLSE